MNKKFMRPKNIQTKYLTLIPIFTSLTAIGAFIKIPLGPIPLSFQVIFVLLSSILLKKYAYISQILYMLLGLMGLPIFTSGGGGLYFLSPTFGYIIGFIISSFITGHIAQANKIDEFKKLFLLSIFGIIIIHVFGVSYLYTLQNFLIKDSSISLLNAIKFGSLVFLISDVFWCFVAATLGSRLINILNLNKNH